MTGLVCDTHMHVYDAIHPPAPAAVLRPPDASVADYRDARAALGIERVVVVQPTTYGMDNRCQLAAMAELGANARGVMVVDSSTPAAELDRLTGLGVRGARFHMLPGGAVGWHELEPTAAAIAERGWHVQLQLDGNRLPELVDRLLDLPTSVVVDHVGRFMPPHGVDSPGVEALRRLVASGRVWVKLSAPYEGSAVPRPHGDVGEIARTLVADAPERMLWASNWPHPGQTDPPSFDDLLAWRADWIPPAHRRRILVDNPAALYGFEME
ncbi:MAG: amidohydrolase family protein [Actinomycetota bacterium]